MINGIIPHGSYIPAAIIPHGIIRRSSFMMAQARSHPTILPWAIPIGSGQRCITAPLIWHRKQKTVITPSPVDIDVPASGSANAEINWTPGLTGHLCIQVEIYHIEEINTDNNAGQENCHVGPTSSPAKVEFTIWNPTKKPQMIYLELRQLSDSLNQGREILWESQIIHPDPQLLKPGEKRDAAVVIDPAKSDVKSGTTVNYSLTGYANGKIIGGANFRITKK
jgi:hypothetical protein